jgi:hypothetical protein
MIENRIPEVARAVKLELFHNITQRSNDQQLVFKEETVIPNKTSLKVVGTALNLDRKGRVTLGDGGNSSPSREGRIRFSHS